jgi:AmmeMemoRadiSam system protein A
MALTSSNNIVDALNAGDRRTLLEAARAAIADGLANRIPKAANVGACSEALRVHAATFVTLELDGALRGCIGTLEAFQPLIVDTAENAYSAAFRDPRFPAMTAAEFDDLDVHISVLGAPESIAFTSERDLIGQLRVGIDGLILSESGRRGTFLPAVWESLADPREFLGQLKMKAGLPRDYWSDTIKVWRYTTASIR